MFLSALYYPVSGVKWISMRCGWDVPLRSSSSSSSSPSPYPPSASSKLSTTNSHSNDNLQSNCSCLQRAQSQSPCATCRARYVYDLAHVGYSDAFERRMNLIIGYAGITVGLCAWALNVRYGWWKMDVAFTIITETLTAHLPTFLHDLFLSSPTILLLNLLLLILIFILLLSFSTICFFMILNPSSKRHWRHMTPAVYRVIAAEMLVYFLFIVWGVRTCEIAFVLGPVCVGGGSLVCVRFMRMGSDGDGDGDGDGRGKRDLESSSGGEEGKERIIDV